MLSFDFYDFKLYYCKRYPAVSYYTVTTNNHRLNYYDILCWNIIFLLVDCRNAVYFTNLIRQRKKNVGRIHSCWNNETYWFLIRLYLGDFFLTNEECRPDDIFMIRSSFRSSERSCLLLQYYIDHRHQKQR